MSGKDELQERRRSRAQNARDEKENELCPLAVARNARGWSPPPASTGGRRGHKGGKRPGPEGGGRRERKKRRAGANGTFKTNGPFFGARFWRASQRCSRGRLRLNAKWQQPAAVQASAENRAAQQSSPRKNWKARSFPQKNDCSVAEGAGQGKIASSTQQEQQQHFLYICEERRRERLHPQ